MNTSSKNILKLFAVGIGSYRIHEPRTCDCFVTLVLAADEKRAGLKARWMCEKHYSYEAGWDQAGGIGIELITQDLQLGDYTLQHKIVSRGTELSSLVDTDNPTGAIPGIYVTAITSHYSWVQDEYTECYVSIHLAHDEMEAKQQAANTRNKLFLPDNGVKWIDSYAVTAVNLLDETTVENYRIQWFLTKRE